MGLFGFLSKDKKEERTEEKFLTTTDSLFENKTKSKPLLQSPTKSLLMDKNNSISFQFTEEITVTKLQEMGSITGEQDNQAIEVNKGEGKLMKENFEDGQKLDLGKTFFPDKNDDKKKGNNKTANNKITNGNNNNKNNSHSNKETTRKKNKRKNNKQNNSEIELNEKMLVESNDTNDSNDNTRNSNDRNNNNSDNIMNNINGEYNDTTIQSESDKNEELIRENEQLGFNDPDDSKKIDSKLNSNINNPDTLDLELGTAVDATDNVVETEFKLNSRLLELEKQNDDVQMEVDNLKKANKELTTQNKDLQETVKKLNGQIDLLNRQIELMTAKAKEELKKSNDNENLIKKLGAQLEDKKEVKELLQKNKKSCQIFLTAVKNSRMKEKKLLSEKNDQIIKFLNLLKMKIKPSEINNQDKIVFTEQVFHDNLNKIKSHFNKIIVENDIKLSEFNSKKLTLEEINKNIDSELRDLKEEHLELQKLIAQITLFNEPIGQTIASCIVNDPTITKLDDIFKKERPDIIGFDKKSASEQIQQTLNKTLNSHNQKLFSKFNELASLQKDIGKKVETLDTSISQIHSTDETNLFDIKTKIEPFSNGMGNLLKAINFNNALIEQIKIQDKLQNDENQKYMLDIMEKTNQENKELRIRLKSQDNEIIELRFENKQQSLKINKLINENKLQIDQNEKLLKKYNMKIYGLDSISNQDGFTNANMKRNNYPMNGMFSEVSVEKIKINEIEKISLVELQDMIKFILCSLMIPLDKIYSKIITLSIIIKWERNLLHFFVNRINYQIHDEEIDFIRLNQDAVNQFYHYKNIDRIKHPLQKTLEELYDNLVNRI